jgi:ribosomal protein S8E
LYATIKTVYTRRSTPTVKKSLFPAPTPSRKRRRKRVEGGKVSSTADDYKRKKKRKLDRQKALATATKAAQRDTRHLTVELMEEIYKRIAVLKSEATVVESEQHETVLSKLLNMYINDDGRLIFLVQWGTVERGVEREVTEEYAEDIIHCEDAIDRFYDYIKFGRDILRGTGRSKATGRVNAGAREVGPEDIGNPKLHEAHLLSQGKNSCMVDAVAMVHRAHGLSFRPFRNFTTRLLR